MNKQEYNEFLMDIAMKRCFVTDLFVEEDKDHVDLPSKCRHCKEKAFDTCKDKTIACNHKDNPTNITKLFTFMVQLDRKIENIMQSAFNDGFCARGAKDDD